MKLHFSLFSLLLLLSVTNANLLFAQQNEEEDAKLLPDIDPQNIEIRGEFKARFPGLERQPILGFDPTRRIYQFPAGRIPYMESYEDAVANLPVSNFSRPAPPAYSPLQYADIQYLFARAGFGSYASPTLQFWGALPISEDSYIGLDINFTASNEGHLNARPTKYRYFTGNIEYGLQLNERMDLYVYAGLQNDFNYAAQFGDENDIGELARIESEGIHAGATLSHFKNEITGWELQAGLRSFTTSYKTEFLPGKIDEKVFHGSFTYSWALGHPGEIITAIASARGGAYEPEAAGPPCTTCTTQPAADGNMQWKTLYAGVAYERLFNYSTRLYAEGDLYYISNFTENGIYPGAKISLSHWFGSRLKLTGRVEAKPFLQTVEQFHEQNRFLGYSNLLRHTYSIRVKGEATLKFYRGSRLYAGVTYLNAQRYSYFSPISISRPAGQLDFYTISYGDVTNMKIYAGIIHQLAPGTFWMNAQIYLQNPKLNGSNEAVPFHENWGLTASATYRPIDRITIKGWTQFLAGREPALSGTELDNILLVGAQLDVRIIDGIGAYVKVINLLDQEYQYWQGYIERPLQLYGGITITL